MTRRTRRGGREHPEPAAARGARERRDGRAAARHRRPRPGRRVQLADHPRGQPPRARSCEDEGKEVVWYASGRRGVSSLALPRPRRGRLLRGLHRPARPSPTRATSPATLAAAYVDGEVDRVEIIYNGYVSPLTQDGHATTTLLPLQAMADADRRRPRTRTTTTRRTADEERPVDHARSWIYEPEPEEILERLVPDYVEISDLPGAARVDSVRARRAHDRHAQRVRRTPASMIDDLTLEMNRQRQAEITQEIMEVVAGAEGLDARPLGSTQESDGS